jgi:hypothetical protein
MADTKTTTKTAATPKTEVKPRKVREIKDRYIVTRPHPKFDGLSQAFTGTGWVVFEESPGWESNAPSIDVKTTTIVAALIGGDAGVRVTKAKTSKSSGLLGDILDGINTIGKAVDTIVDTVDDVVS